MAQNVLPTDPTLDEVRAALAPIIARNAAFDGWSKAAVEMAASQAGVDPVIAALAFDGGAMAMIDAWFAHIDTEMIAACPSETLDAMKIRQKITSLVEARLAAMEADRESLRRALSILAMPQNMARAAQLGWRAADHMWRAAGDTSVDYNYYTKRSILAGIYAASLLVFVNDKSDNHAETSAFLARRIEGIMRFEKAKARFTRNAERRPSLARFVGRLRYHAR
ncbi:MAG: COQ9 family protein [Sphingomonadaceae bacterium]|jgi:ubiquinone biosynthesis protein COQ9